MSFAHILEGIDAAARKKLDAKLPSWKGALVEVPSSLNFQQCSSEPAARYKASLLQPGERVADLTGGLGADSWAFAVSGHPVWYNERDAVLRRAVEKNFASLGLAGVVFNGHDIMPGGPWEEQLRAFAPDVIYLDPARRDTAGRKLFLLEHCSPDVMALMPSLLRIAPRVMVKVSPMADITMLRRRLEGVLESIHVVGVEGECKELLCLCRDGAGWQGVTLWEDGSAFDPAHAGEPGDLLFFPSAAFVKSALGATTGLPRLSGTTEIYRSSFCESLLPFGAFYTLLENLPFSKSVFPGIRVKYPCAMVSARDIHMTSEELRAALRVKQGAHIRILGCSLDGSRRLLVLQKVGRPE